LIATTNEQMERLFNMLRQQVGPKRVITTLESWAAEVVWIYTGTKSIALVWIKALETALSNDDFDYSQSKRPHASFDDDQEQRNPSLDHR
jgi:hypothetical protein